MQHTIDTQLPMEIVERICSSLEFDDMKSIFLVFPDCVPQTVKGSIASDEDIQFLEWISEKYESIESLYLTIDPNIWNKNAPNYFVGKRLRRVHLYPCHHQDIAATIWEPDADEIDNGFFDATSGIIIEAEDTSIKFVSQNPQAVPMMLRHHSVDRMDIVGQMNTEQLPLEIQHIRLLHSTLTEESFTHLMQTRHTLVMEQVHATLCKPVVCYASIVTMTAQALQYIDSFPNCQHLHIHINQLTDILIDRKLSVDRVRVTGTFPTTSYRSVFCAICYMFPTSDIVYDLSLR